jgi:hypothetical protein
MMNSKVSHIVFIFYIIILTGLISVCLGRDVNFDLLTYHYYIGYAFLNIPLTQDFFAGSIQSYLNPLTDVMNYLLIAHLPAKLAGFVLGAIQGVSFYWLMMIAIRFLTPNSSWLTRIILIGAIPILALLTPNVRAEIGAIVNDLTLSNCILLGVMLIGFSLQADWSTPKGKSYILFAGLAIGIGAGLKLTFALYFIGAWIALCVLLSFQRKSESMLLGDRIKILIWFSLGGLLGFLLTNGYWLLALWKLFHNPLFPYYNKIFKSPYFYAFNLVDSRFFPKGLLQHLFYPFYFSWKPSLVNGYNFWDFRLPVVYILLIIYLGALFFKRRNRSQTEYFNCPQQQFSRFLIIFSIISYIVWQCQFSTQRYLIVVDILSPLLIYLLVTKIFSGGVWANRIVLVIFALLALPLHHVKMARAHWGKLSFFEVKIPADIDLQKPSVVICIDPASAYLRPFFPRNWHFMNINIDIPVSEKIPGSYLDLPAANKLIAPWLQPRNFNIYTIYFDTDRASVARQLAQYGLQISGSCSLITSRIRYYFICPVNLL